ncbi:MAG: ABC transporter [Clostridiales bacterium]|nr:MAG: ABC transporter [Clostridiales bacterium]
MSIFVDIEKKLGSFTLQSKFSVNNETLSLLGESGCGKSITLRCIAGLVKPDKGRIVVDDKVFFDSNQKINLTVQERRTGMLFQHYALFPNMSVYNNIMLGTKREVVKSIRKKLVDEIITKFNISDIANSYPNKISGGQQQRVALARILVSKPDILLLDEPFSALDSHLKFKLERELINTINDFSKTVIFVSHNRDEVYRLSDSIAIMKNGMIEQIGKKEEVFKNPRTKNGALLTGCKNISDVTILSENKVLTDEWGIELEVDKIRCNGHIKSVGIRLHDIKIVYDKSLYPNIESEPNVFQCKISEKIENTFSYTLMLNVIGVNMKTPIGATIGKEFVNKINDNELQIMIPKDSIICI